MKKFEISRNTTFALTRFVSSRMERFASSSAWTCSFDEFFFSQRLDHSVMNAVAMNQVRQKARMSVVSPKLKETMSALETPESV